MTFTPTWTNKNISLDDLPAIKKEDFEPVDPKYLRLIYFRIVIMFFIMGASFSVFLLISDEGLPPILTWILVGTIAITSIYALIISKLSFPFRGYLIREKDLSYKHGLIAFKLSTIPYKRIQHVELNQGIMAKKMGLASIKIYTAGTSSDDLSIPGLPIDIAVQVRTFLTDKINNKDDI